jgi:hypothetical protein
VTDDGLPELIPLREVAALAGVADSTVNRWAQSGRFGPVRYRPGDCTGARVERAAVERELGITVTPARLATAQSVVAGMNAKRFHARRVVTPGAAFSELTKGD